MSRIYLFSLLLSTSLTSASALAGTEPECVPVWETDVADFAVLNSRVSALAVFDDGSGPALYAGGQFTHAGDLEVNYIARWDGTQWSSVGGGLTSDQLLGVFALEVFDDGSGPALFVGGSFETAGGLPYRNVAKWDGTEWQDVGSGHDFEPIVDFVAFDDGEEEKLFAASSGLNAGWIVSAWDGTSWNLVLEDVGRVESLLVHDDGAGEMLYAAGEFEGPAGVDALNIARWNGDSWQSLGTDLDDRVLSLASMIMPDGSSFLFAGGEFTLSSGGSTSPVAVWDGTNWTPLIDPLVQLQNSSIGIRALEVFDDGTGPELFVGGGFVVGEPLFTRGIVKWTGSEFTSLGNGGTEFGAVFTMLPTLMNDDQSLLIGGTFNAINSTFLPDGLEIESPYLAIWRGCTPALCRGDVTGDYTVDLADLNLVLSNFGQQTDSGDSDGDGVVDLADLNTVLANFGSGC